MSLREWVSSVRVRWRRRRLLAAYASVFKRRTGKRVGFTPLMAAWESAERDGVLSLEDGEVVWHWPEEAGDVVDRGDGIDTDGGDETDDAVAQKTECKNCGKQRYTFERCQHCGNVHWEDDVDGGGSS